MELSLSLRLTLLDVPEKGPEIRCKGGRSKRLQFYFPCVVTCVSRSKEGRKRCTGTPWDMARRAHIERKTTLMYNSEYKRESGESDI